MRTPWGEAQTIEKIIPGLVLVSTASHGGVRVGASLTKYIPEIFRTGDNWYEEDCEIEIPMYFLKAKIAEVRPEWVERNEIKLSNCEDAIKYWFKDQWEKYKGDQQ